MRKVIRFLILIALIAALLCLSLSLYIIAITNSSIYYSVAAVPRAQVAVVLGASVSANGTLSPVLKERADTAIALYEAHKVPKILVTGDDGTPTYDEVYPVGKYLLAAGIPQQDIFLDYAGFDTYSSMYRAQDVFDVTSMIIASQRFHLPRALFIAHALGITAYGVDASHGEKYLPNSLREIAASVKALYDVVSQRVPKYLGTQFPITGDGTLTWAGGTVNLLYFVNG